MNQMPSKRQVWLMKHRLRFALWKRDSVPRRPALRTGLMIFAAALLLSSAVTAYACWPEINNFFLTIGDKQLTITDDEDSSAINLRGCYLPSYIPDGYYIDTRSDSVPGLTVFTLTNAEKQEIQFRQYALGTSMDADTERIENVREIQIGTAPGVYTEGTEKTTLIWWCANMRFCLTSENVPLEELRGMAESVSFQE